MMRLILIVFSILCCLATLVRHSDAEIDPTTAVAVWLFNETDGDTASDASENGNDGTLQGDPEWVPDGKFGNALELDGAGDYVSVPDHKTLDTELSEALTIVIWVKGTYRPNDWHGLVTKAQGWQVDMCYLLQRAANGKFEFAPFGEAGNTVWTASNILPKDDTWYHVAGVYTGEEAQIHVDGVLSGTRVFSAEIADTNAPVVIGTNYPTGIQPVNGLIDEAAIFSVALEEEDINAIMNDGLEETLGILAVEPSDKLALMWGDLKVGHDK
ncbi:LamG domain-containing protein [Candidatus Poribacteria bacterium]|nr:LamG domain-containing protein [Candidatus Poribacteria bacterium]